MLTIATNLIKIIKQYCRFACNVVEYSSLIFIKNILIADKGRNVVYGIILFTTINLFGDPCVGTVHEVPYDLSIEII